MSEARREEERPGELYKVVFDAQMPKLARPFGIVVAVELEYRKRRESSVECTCCDIRSSPVDRTPLVAISGTYSTA
jgi:hypothetical protein